MIDVVAAVLFEAGRLLLAPRTTGEYAGRFEFPGGKVEVGETWAEALERELLEELALPVTVHTHLLSLEHRLGNRLLALHFLACRRVVTASEPPLPAGAGWFTLDEAGRLDLCPADADALRRLPWRSIAQCKLHLQNDGSAQETKR